MRTAALLLALASTLAGAESSTLRVAGIELAIPAQLAAKDEPPPGTLACYRSADGRAAIAVVERRGGHLPRPEEQAAELMALGHELDLRAHSAAGEGWHRLRYRLTLGGERWVQDARIATMDAEERQVVVTASWPLAEAERWDAVLTAVLDALPAASD